MEKNMKWKKRMFLRVCPPSANQGIQACISSRQEIRTLVTQTLDRKPVQSTKEKGIENNVNPTTYTSR